MIVESSEHGELATAPLPGALAGIAGAGVLLGVLTLVDGEGSTGRWFAALGRLVPSIPAEDPSSMRLAGMSVHFVIGGLLGALHGASQQRTALSGLFAVGAFYGFVLWLVSGLVLVRLLNLDLPLLQAWSGLPAVVAFGLTLAAWAGVDQQRHVRTPRGAVPVD